MFTFLAVGILWLCFAVYWYFHTLKHPKWYAVGKTDWITVSNDAMLAWLVTALGAALAALLISGIVNSHLPRKTVTHGPYQLVAMHSGDSLSGGFVYGSSFGSTMYNRFIVKNADGTMSQKQLAVTPTTTIIESSDMHGQGQWVQKVESYDYSVPMARWAMGDDYVTTTDIFTIPVGSVVQDIQVK